MSLAASKRRAITVSASALAAAALVVAVAGRGCADDPGPAEAVRALALAASAGDREAVIDLLGPATRDRLEREVRRASELVGGSKRYEAADLVTLGAPDESGLPAQLAVRYLDDDRAIVSLGKAPDGADELLVVRAGGRWLIELPAYSHAP